MKPTYFDLTVHDLNQAREFFQSALGWRFEKFPMPYEYYRIQAVPQNEPGIDGGVGAVKDAPISGGNPMTLITVPVPDIEEAMLRVHGTSRCEMRCTQSFQAKPMPSRGRSGLAPSQGGTHELLRCSQRDLAPLRAR